MANRTTIILVLLAFGAFGVVFLDRTKPEPTVETMVEVVPIVVSEEIMAGKQTFDENCAVCHGDNAAGREGIAPPLIHKIYKPSHHADIAFKLAAQVGVRSHHWSFGDMPPVPSVNEDDMVSVIAYLRKLQVANGIE